MEEAPQIFASETDQLVTDGGDMPLFRQEVLQARASQWMGRITLPRPLSSWLLTGLTCFCAVSVLVFLFFGSYTRHESVGGELVPTKGLLPIIARSASVVTARRVHEGEMVVKDQALVELSGETDSLSVGQTQVMISNDLRAQLGELEALLQSQQRVAEQQHDSLTGRVVLLNQQLVETDRQAATEQKKTEITAHRLEKFQNGLKTGTFSAVELETYQAEVLSGNAQLNILSRLRLDTEQQLRVLQGQLQELPLTTKAQVNELHLRILASKQSLAQNEVQRAVVLRAPENGQVTNLVVQAGQPVTAGQRLLSVLPQGSPLEAELWLPTLAVGFIEVGNRVVLRYPAFPYQKFGQQNGWVQELSRSATSAPELTGLLGRTVSEPLYRVLVRLERQDVDAYGRPEVLKPGMVVDADILLERRRLVEWVFEPLYGTVHLLRDPAPPKF